MPHIRASLQASDFIEQYRKERKLTSAEALDALIERLKYLEDVAGHHATEESEDLECQRRVIYEDKNYCVQTDQKGLRAMKEIKTLDVCLVCKTVKWHIPEKAKVEQEPEPKAARPEVKRWNIPLKRYGANERKIDMGASEGIDPFEVDET